MNPLVSVIIVNWNGYKHLRPCIESLLRISYKHFEIVCVDNASTDQSTPYIRQLQKAHKNIVLVKNKRNEGFALGNTIGVEHAKGELILFLNNDTLVENNFLEPLIVRLQSKKIAAVQPTIFQYPQKQLVDSIGSYFLYSGFLYHVYHNKSLPKKGVGASRIFTMKGACMLIKKSVLDIVGVFDPDYFAYFEETDLCQRIWIAGYEVWFEPNSAIYHKGGATANKISSVFITYHSYKNRIYTYAKNLEFSTILRVLPVHIATCLLASVAYLVTGQFALALAIVRAILYPALHMSKVKKDRAQVTAFRKVQDSQYLAMCSARVKPNYYYHLFTTSLRGYTDEI